MAVSTKAVSLLADYHSVLYRFKAYGSKKVYSFDIADALGFSAAQVRKDFSLFKMPGKKKVGYEVDLLIKSIDQLLRKNQLHRAVLCGLGHTGVSLIKDQQFSKTGFTITATFDEAADGEHQQAGQPRVMPLSSLIKHVADNKILFGIIASADKDAQRMLDLLVLAGIKGVLNLSSAELKAPKNCIVNSINVVREFEKLVYYVTNGTNKKQAVAVP